MTLKIPKIFLACYLHQLEITNIISPILFFFFIQEFPPERNLEIKYIYQFIE
jgi:hypothetical protein